MYHGWLIVLLSSVLFLVHNGIKMSWGVFVTTFSKDPMLGSSSQATIGVIQSVFFLCCAALSFIGKITSHDCGYKISAFVGTVLVVLGLSLSAIAPSVLYLIFSHGVLYGLGINILVSPLYLIVADWFPWEHRYHVMCTSWSMVTMPLGTVVFGNFIQWLHQTIGWRYGYLVLATLYALWATVTIHTLNKPSKEVLREAIQPYSLLFPGHKAPPSVEIKWSQQIRTVVMVIWFVIYLSKGICQTISYAILVRQVEILGYTSKDGVHCLTADGVAGFLSRLLVSALGDRVKGYILYIYVICASLLMVNNVLAPFFTTLTWMFIYSTVLGLGQGPIIAAWYAACAEVLSGQDVQTLFVILRSGIGLGCAVGPFFSGVIYDISGSYKPAFLTMAALYLVNALLTASIILINSVQKKLAKVGSVGR